MAELLEATLERSRLPGRAPAPSARSRPRAGSRTSRSWSGWRASSTPIARSRVPELAPLEEFLQAISLVHRPGRPRARREPGNPDDPAQRQGPRVRGGVHDRLRGGGLPPQRAPSRRKKRRRSAGSSYVGITRAKRRLWLTHARSRRVFAGREVGICLALSLRAARGSWSSARKGRGAEGA